MLLRLVQPGCHAPSPWRRVVSRSARGEGGKNAVRVATATLSVHKSGMIFETKG